MVRWPNDQRTIFQWLDNGSQSNPKNVHVRVGLGGSVCSNNSKKPSHTAWKIYLTCFPYKLAITKFYFHDMIFCDFFWNWWILCFMQTCLLWTLPKKNMAFICWFEKRTMNVDMNIQFYQLIFTATITCTCPSEIHVGICTYTKDINIYVNIYNFGINCIHMYIQIR